MPDKEFDKLFQDKFADAEITPSADLWSNIEKELEPKKRKIFPVYWMAAASVAVALSAILIFQKKEVIQLHGNDPIAVVEPKTKVESFQSAPFNPEAIVEKRTFAKAEPTVVKVQGKQFASQINQPAENISKENQLALQPTETNNRLAIKQQDPRPIDMAPIRETPVENPVVIAQAQVTEKIEDHNISEAGTERKGIRNVGDLVNYVVDKVDKRDKKLVRFDTDDDDNSSIIGINIGFLKFNKKNKDK